MQQQTQTPIYTWDNKVKRWLSAGTHQFNPTDIMYASPIIHHQQNILEITRNKKTPPTRHLHKNIHKKCTWCDERLVPQTCRLCAHPNHSNCGHMNSKCTKCQKNKPTQTITDCRDLITVCDGSLHNNKKATYGLIIKKTNGITIHKQNGWIPGSKESQTSFHGELAGIIQIVFNFFFMLCCEILAWVISVSLYFLEAAGLAAGIAGNSNRNSSRRPGS